MTSVIMGDYDLKTVSVHATQQQQVRCLFSRLTWILHGQILHQPLYNICTCIRSDRERQMSVTEKSWRGGEGMGLKKREREDKVDS